MRFSVLALKIRTESESVQTTICVILLTTQCFKHCDQRTNCNRVQQKFFIHKPILLKTLHKRNPAQDQRVAIGSRSGRQHAECRHVCESCFTRDCLLIVWSKTDSHSLVLCRLTPCAGLLRSLACSWKVVSVWNFFLQVILRMKYSNATLPLQF